MAHSVNISICCSLQIFLERRALVVDRMVSTYTLEPFALLWRPSDGNDLGGLEDVFSQLYDNAARGTRRSRNNNRLALFEIEGLFQGEIRRQSWTAESTCVCHSVSLCAG